jgi:hypothetical protein
VGRVQAQAQPTLPEIHLTFTTIDVPGAAVTNVEGINSTGAMTGAYGAATNSPGHGFLFANGNFTLFDYPGGDDTIPVGINDSGTISGSSFVRNSTAIVSFLYAGGSFTTVRAPGKTVTLANGINNAGIIVGGYGSLAATGGFARIGTSYKTISPPGEFINVFAHGINNFRQIVGTGDDTGFLYRNGVYKTIAVPGAFMTQPLGINDLGIVVGWYGGCSPSCSIHGFALKQGKYLSFDFPGASETFGLGINNGGMIVGSYTIDGSNYHGFVTSPITGADFEEPIATD